MVAYTKVENHRKEKKVRRTLCKKENGNGTKTHSVKRRIQRNKSQNKPNKDTRQLCFIILPKHSGYLFTAKNASKLEVQWAWEGKTSLPRKQRITLTEPLCHLEPLRASVVIVPNASSHPITSIILRRYSKASEHLLKKREVDRVVCLL